VYANNVGGVYSSNAISMCVYGSAYRLICVCVPCHSTPSLSSMGGVNPTLVSAHFAKC